MDVVEVADDEGQGVVDFMPHARGQPAHGGQPVGEHELGLHRLELPQAGGKLGVGALELSGAGAHHLLQGRVVAVEISRGRLHVMAALALGGLGLGLPQPLLLLQGGPSSSAIRLTARATEPSSFLRGVGSSAEKSPWPSRSALERSMWSPRISGTSRPAASSARSRVAKKGAMRPSPWARWSVVSSSAWSCCCFWCSRATTWPSAGLTSCS